MILAVSISLVGFAIAASVLTIEDEDQLSKKRGASALACFVEDQANSHLWGAPVLSPANSSISVKLRNRSTKVVSGLATFRFELTKPIKPRGIDSYVGNVGILGNDPWTREPFQLPNGNIHMADKLSKSTIHLKPGEEIQIASEIARLRWDCFICSNLRLDDSDSLRVLFDRVPNGPYRLKFSAQIQDDTTSHRLEVHSKEMTVQIAGSARQGPAVRDKTFFDHFFPD